MFEPTALNARNDRVQSLFRLLFGLMTALLILPVLIILATLIHEGGSIVSFEFLFSSPTDGMTAGGIFPALLGTMWLVAVALLISVPLGVAAAIYLSEYAPENWLTRVINLAIINLAGVPSIVHALFGVGAFVLGVIAEHTGLRPPIATAAVIGMVIWYTVWRQRRVIVQSLQTTTTPSKQGK